MNRHLQAPRNKREGRKRDIPRDRQTKDNGLHDPKPTYNPEHAKREDDNSILPPPQRIQSLRVPTSQHPPKHTPQATICQRLHGPTSKIRHNRK